MYFYEEEAFVANLATRSILFWCCCSQLAGWLGSPCEWGSAWMAHGMRRVARRDGLVGRAAASRLCDDPFALSRLIAV